MAANRHSQIQRITTEARRALSVARNLVGQINPYLLAPTPYLPQGRPRVLVVGIYLGERANLVEHLVEAFASASACEVEQQWIALGRNHISNSVRRVTVRVIEKTTPKFCILNQQLAATDLSRFDYVIVSDDDIRIRSRFIDSFIGCQQRFDLAVAQPARTINSFNDHGVVRRKLGSRARQTWFVEIGPLFSVRRDAMKLLLPFDESSPMGYGYDFLWPTVIRKAGKRMGIVDCCPVDHSLRGRSTTYAYDAQIAEMEQFLATREHEPYAHAMRTVKRLR